MFILLIIFALVSNLFSVVGFNCYKLAVFFPSKKQAIFVTLGLLFQATGIVFDILSLQYGPQALKAAVSASPIILNVPIGHFMDKFIPGQDKNKTQRKTKCTSYLFLDIVFIVLLSGGLVMCCMSFFLVDSSSVYEMTAQDVLLYVTSPVSVVFQVIFVLIALIGGILACSIPGSVLHMIIILPLFAGIFSMLGSLFIKTCLHILTSIYAIEMVAYGYAGAVAMASQLVISLLCVSMYEKNTPTQIYITIYTSSYIILNMTSGGVVYGEFTDFKTEQWAMLISGLVISIGSLIGLGLNNRRKSFIVDLHD